MGRPRRGGTWQHQGVPRRGLARKQNGTRQEAFSAGIAARGPGGSPPCRDAGAGARARPHRPREGAASGECGSGWGRRTGEGSVRLTRGAGLPASERGVKGRGDGSRPGWRSRPAVRSGLLDASARGGARMRMLGRGARARAVRAGERIGLAGGFAGWVVGPTSGFRWV